MNDKQGRSNLEWQAVQMLYVKLKQIRDFEIYTPGIDYRCFDFKTFDMCTVGFMFGMAARHYFGKGKRIDRLVIGTHKDEGHWQKRWDTIEKMIDVHVEGANFPHDPIPLHLQDPLPTKREEIDYLDSQGLLDYTWFCREPKKRLTIMCLVEDVPHARKLLRH